MRSEAVVDPDPNMETILLLSLSAFPMCQVWIQCAVMWTPWIHVDPVQGDVGPMDPCGSPKRGTDLQIHTWIHMDHLNEVQTSRSTHGSTHWVAVR